MTANQDKHPMCTMEELRKTIYSFKESPHVNDPLLFHLSHYLYQTHISVISLFKLKDIKIFGLQSVHRLKDKLPWNVLCQIYSLKTSGQTTIY